MNYNSWRKKYPLKPFPHKLKKFGFFEKPSRDHLLAIQMQDALMRAHQTAINNYGTTMFFGNTYPLFTTTIPTSIENITSKYIA